LSSGLRQMEPAFEPLHKIGLFSLLSGVVMVDTLMRAGRGRDALALIARLLGEMSDPKMGMFVSELWRIRGELIARERGGDTALAEHSLQQACKSRAGKRRRSYNLERVSHSRGTSPSTVFVRKQGPHFPSPA